MPVVTHDLVNRLVAIEISNLESRLRPYAEREGNPAGVRIARFGSATAFLAERIPVRFYNSVLGTGADSIDDLDAIMAFYGERGVCCTIEIVPSRMTEELGCALADRGFAMVEFHAGLARTLEPADAIPLPPSGVEVVEVPAADAHAFETFLDVHLEGWGSTDPEDAKENMRGWRANDSWRFYLASCEGTMAGTAILDVYGKTALLGSASTRPSMRGRRVQSALVARRKADAASMGCDLLVGGAYAGTTSMRVQQHAGLEIMFTRGVWIERRALS